MLKNAYLLGKIGADTAGNEQHFAGICQKLATTLLVLGDVEQRPAAALLDAGLGRELAERFNHGLGLRSALVCFNSVDGSREYDFQPRQTCGKANETKCCRFGSPAGVPLCASTCFMHSDLKSHISELNAQWQ